MKNKLTLFEKAMSSRLPIFKVPGDMLANQPKTVVIRSPRRVSKMMAEKIRAILMKQVSALLASVWLPVS